MNYDSKRTTWIHVAAAWMTVLIVASSAKAQFLGTYYPATDGFADPVNGNTVAVEGGPWSSGGVPSPDDTLWDPADLGPAVPATYRNVWQISPVTESRRIRTTVKNLDPDKAYDLYAVYTTRRDIVFDFDNFGIMRGAPDEVFTAANNGADGGVAFGGTHNTGITFDLGDWAPGYEISQAPAVRVSYQPTGAIDVDSTNGFVTMRGNWYLGLAAVEVKALELYVNTSSGAMSIQNRTGQPIEITSYSVNSDLGRLNVANWSSLHDAQLPGWDEIDHPSDKLLFETSLTNSAVFASGAQPRNLGQSFRTGQEGDLLFQYLVKGGGIELGLVRYFSGPLLGDMNGSGQVNNLDIAPFALALTDPAAFSAQFPNVNATTTGDINQDSMFNNLDITPFANLLTGGPASVPEPSSWILLSLGAAVGAVSTCRRRRIAA